MRFGHVAAAAALAVIAAIVTPSAAIAQDESLAQAREHFDAAQKLYGEGNYEKAAERFLEAYAARPFPQFLFNVAASYERLRDYRRATLYYSRYLTENPDAEDKDEIKKRVSVLKKEEKRLRDSGKPDPKKDPPSQEVAALGEVQIRGLVVIESDPVGATIYLDDKGSKPLGKTPWNGTLQGDHTVHIVRQGYKPVEKLISPDPNRLLVLYFSLAEEDYLGWIKITANVPGADIYLDSKDVGVYRKTPWQGNIEPGKHKIWVVKEGYDEHYEEIEVVRGATHTIKARLEGEPVGFIYVRGNVDKASIYIDGKLACKKGPCRKPLPAGDHTVTIKRPGYKDYVRELDLQAQTELTLRPRLAEEPGRIDAYVAYGISAALLGTGIGLGIASNNVKNDLNDDIAQGAPPPDPQDPRFKKSRILSIAADGAFVVSGLALATALYYTFREKGPLSTGKTDIRRLAVEPQLGPGYAGVGMGVSW